MKTRSKATTGEETASGICGSDLHLLDDFMPTMQKGDILITHRIKLANVPAAYKTFRDKKDGCIKVVLSP
jgi:threonine dehydrogenase-like Zn-dependent dehydrogenase